MNLFCSGKNAWADNQNILLEHTNSYKKKITLESMKVLVRRSENGLFYGGLQKGSNQPNWVTDPEGAHDFRNSLAAFNYCMDSGGHEQGLNIYLLASGQDATVIINPAPERANKQGGSKLEERLDQPQKGKE